MQRDHLKNQEISILDLGFGTGYGCALLSSLPKSRVIGIDIDPICEVFAGQYYSRSNVDYIIESLESFIPKMATVDYAVSSGVLEHVHDGLNLIKDIKFKKRVMIDVPYDEVPGNQHHVLTGIREEAFADLENCEIFYEDLQGVIYDKTCCPPKPNMIMIVISAPGLPKIANLMTFPIDSVKTDELEIAGRQNLGGKKYYYHLPEQLLSAVEKVIKETEIVADLGCGIMPMNYFRPKLHFLIEPWKEYTDILSHRNSSDKSIIILRMKALEALSGFADNSLDSIFLLDVIEHLDKEEGLQVLAQCERVAREQIIIFTPYGFMQQHINPSEKDGWGLSGHDFQEHRSGWLPSDFSSEWSFYICHEFHHVDHHNIPLEKPFGAFFAIRNFENKTVEKPEKLSDVRRPLPSEIMLRCVEEQCRELENENHMLLARNKILSQLPVNRILSAIKRIFKRIFLRLKCNIGLNEPS